MTTLQRFPDSLAPALRTALTAAIEAASHSGMSLYVAGGAVRDFVLGLPVKDVDLVVESDPAAVVDALASRLDARVTRHDRFGTATLKGAGFVLDIARSRRETYAHPGALPVVEPASIDEDLGRRDFTINAMAIRLTGPVGEFLDPHDGRSDLEAGAVRVLHHRSFKDDPTRILRALRYAARLRFALEPGTEALMARALHFIDTLSPARVRREISLGLAESERVAMFELAENRGVLRTVNPCLALPAGVAEAWRAAEAGTHFGDPQLLGWCLLLACPDEEGIAAIDQRLGLTSPVRHVLTDFVRLREHFAKLAPVAETDVELLDRLAPEATWAVAALGGEKGAVARTYLERSRKVRQALDGDDLLEAGVPPGPEVGRILRLLRRKLIEGEVTGREQEMALVREEIARSRSTATPQRGDL